MSGSRKSLGFSFYVTLPSEIKGTPTKRSIANRFDFIGHQLSMKRLNGESNIDFKKRTWDKTVHRGDITYDGVINNIARELGFLRKPAFILDIKRDSNGLPLAESPRIDILANRVVLYRDWRPNGTEVIDKEIRTYKLGDEGYYLNNLIAAINESSYFSATIDPDVRTNLITSNIIKNTTTERTVNDYIKADRYNPLDNKLIIKDSLKFQESLIFKTEVSGEPAVAGEYNVDYNEGIVLSYSTPSGEGNCSYYYSFFPLQIDYVPIQVFSLNDENFTDELFEKKQLDSGELINGLPNEEGSEIYHQLFMNSKVFWGE